MTLTIELNPETENWLLTEAEKHGLDANEYARRLIESYRPPAQEKPWQELTPEERAARVQAVMGKYAHVPFSTEDLHRERQEDKAREEAAFQRDFSSRKPRI